jgi:hypothetical protein
MNAIQTPREQYSLSLPDRPYCTNNLGGKLRILDRERASGYAIIQHNSPLILKWMVFDIDSADAYYRANDRGCPPPTFIALNPANGHCHAAYFLEKPVTAFAASSRSAIQFYDDVERGLTHKLGADCAYSGFLSKNPLSSRWETDWQAVRPYRLDTLNDCLDSSDKRRALIREPSAIGRNYTTFDAIRVVAYKRCLSFKKDGRTFDEFALMLRESAQAVNCTFSTRLSDTEIKSIVRSVAKWVWNEFTIERFSAIQRKRATKRFAKIATLTWAKPWEHLAISRATWYRRRASS